MVCFKGSLSVAMKTFRDFNGMRQEYCCQAQLNAGQVLLITQCSLPILHKRTFSIIGSHCHESYCRCGMTGIVWFICFDI